MDASMRCIHTQEALINSASPRTRPVQPCTLTHVPLHSTTQAQAGRPPDRESLAPFLVPVSPPAMVMMGPLHTLGRRRRCRPALLLASLLWVAALLYPANGFNGPSLFLPRPRLSVGRTAGVCVSMGSLFVCRGY